MKTYGGLFKFVLAALCPLLLSNNSFAQNSVSYISSAGDDNNPCTIAAPCASLDFTIGSVADKGEVKCLDAGPFYVGTFGDLFITQSLLIDCSDVRATVIAGVPLGVAAGPDDTVLLRGLNFQPSPSGTNDNAILLNGGALEVVDCVVHGMNSTGPDGGNGIYVAPGSSSTTKLSVRNSTFAGNGSSVYGAAISIKPTGSGKVHAVVTDSVFDNNAMGIWLVGFGGGVALTVSNTSLSSNIRYGLIASGNSNVNIMGSTIASNLGSGIVSVSPSIVRVGSSIIASNVRGVYGNVFSYGNNQMAGNGIQGSVTTIPPALPVLP